MTDEQQVEIFCSCQRDALQPLKKIKFLLAVDFKNACA